MSNDNSKLVCEVESTLLQVQSMVKIALDNHNYKCAGYSEPFIKHIDMGNLLWAIIDLTDSAYNKLQQVAVYGGDHHG